MKNNLAVKKIDTGDFKILLFDIETTPHLSYTWGKYEQNVIAFKEYGDLLCYSYKWLGEDKIHAVGLNTMTKRQLIHSLWCLFNEAEIIIAHNGDSFDIKMANQYFIRAGLKPPETYKTIDTKKLAKKTFRFVSNKLDDLGDYLGIGRKINTGGFELWKGCMENNRDAWKQMLAYNKRDVALLEKVYLLLRAWSPHPNLNLKNCVNKCPVCQSNNLECRGFSYKIAGKYQRYQCRDCGRWSLGEKVKEHVIIK